MSDVSFTQFIAPISIASRHDFHISFCLHLSLFDSLGYSEMNAITEISVVFSSGLFSFSYVGSFDILLCDTKWMNELHRRFTGVVIGGFLSTMTPVQWTASYSYRVSITTWEKSI